MRVIILIDAKNFEQGVFSVSKKRGEFRFIDVEVFDKPHTLVCGTLRAQAICLRWQIAVQQIPFKRNLLASQSPHKLRTSVRSETQGLCDLKNILRIRKNKKMCSLQ